jgi:predicted alpha/beta-hydrolase family hydrolase
VTQPTLLLGPGASGGIERLKPHLAGLRKRGVSASSVPLPKGTAERALPVYREALETADPEGGGTMVIGGHSFGGRMASLLAAERPVRGVVLLSYPLHAPGRPDAWDDRTAHWPRIACPVLLLSGESDPFTRIELLRGALPRLQQVEVHTYPGVGHGLEPVLDDALDRIAAFVKRLG